MVNFLFDRIKNKMSFRQKNKAKRVINNVRAFFYRKDLDKLAQIYKTDKYGTHYYTPNYSKHFKPFRKRKINLFEIGVGGYKLPLAGGHSLRMWKAYFRRGKIFSVDIYDKSALQENRIKIFKGSQIDTKILDEIYESADGCFDIIVDDGSHVNSHVIETFEYLFPKLSKGGIYVVEDTQTSYWNDYGGVPYKDKESLSIMNYFKALADGVNYMEYIIDDYTSSYYDKNIVSIHFYHNMIFIYKDDNNEKSNYLVNNSIPSNG